MTTQLLDNTSDMDSNDDHIDTNNRQFDNNNRSSKSIYLFNPFINHKFIVLSHKVAPMIKKYFNTQNSALSPNTLNSSLRIASHNVNGLNSKGKQLSLVQSMNHKHLDILGICDTRLIQKNANFACNSDTHYRTFWTPKLPSNVSGGLGLIIHKKYSKFVQLVTRWSYRILAIDLYMAGRNKLRIINVYIPPINSISHNTNLRQDTINETLRLTKEVSNSHCIILGDFNMDLDDFTYKANQGSHIPSSYNLFSYLRNHNFTDSHPIFEDYTIPTFVRKDAITHLPTSVSRIDTIWVSSSLCPDILQAETWDTEAFHESDHNMIISYFAKDLLFGSTSQAHLKQNKVKRKIFVYKRMDDEKWSDFVQETDISLAIQSSKFPPSNRSSILNNLNRLWQIFHTALIKSANKHIPTTWINLKQINRIPDELRSLYTDRKSTRLNSSHTV